MSTEFYRVVIQTVPTGRFRKGMTGAELESIVASEVPISGWHGMQQAYELMLWLKQHRPILTDGVNILSYALKSGQWESEQPPPPVPFDQEAVAKFPKFDVPTRAKTFDGESIHVTGKPDGGIEIYVYGTEAPRVRLSLSRRNARMIGQALIAGENRCRAFKMRGDAA